MRKSLSIFFLVFTTFSFAQQSPNSIFNYNKSTDNLLLQNSSKLSLNVDSFKLKGSIQKHNSLSELPNQIIKPIHNIPIFAPGGNFFFRTYDVDKDIDHKLRIFEVEKSKYFLRSVG